MSLRVLALALGFIVAPNGCRKAEEASPTSSPPQGETPPQTPTPDSPDSPEPAPAKLDRSEAVEAHMRQHFEEVSGIKDAVIDGDVEAAREQAEALAARQSEVAAPAAWTPHLEALARATDDARTATELQAAAKSAGGLAAACGGCHRALDAKPAFDAPPQPEAEESVRADMERHQWAADRMWEGIVGPSEHAWTEGTRVFQESVGCSEGTQPELYPVALCRRVHALGREAGKAEAIAARGEIYGRFLTTCAECHHAVDAAVEP